MKKPAFGAAALLSTGAAAAAVTIAAIGNLPPGALLAQTAVLCLGAAGSALILRNRKTSAEAGLRRIAEATGVPQAASEGEPAMIAALTHRLAAAGEHRLPAAAARACDTPMTVFDADDRPLFLNQSFVSFAGDLEPVIGERSNDPKAAAAELLCHLRKHGKALSRRGETVEFTLDGVTLEAVMSTFETEGDRPSLCVTWRDITSVTEARGLVAAMDMADCRLMLDPSGRIVEANDIAAELLGRRTDDLLGERIETLFTAEDGLPDWRDLTAGRAIRADLLPHGSEEEIQTTFYPLVGPNGHLARTLCIGSPSRRGNQRAAAVLAAIGSAQAVIEFGADGSVIGASDGASAVLGQAGGTLQGQSHAAICGAPPSDTARIWGCLKSGAPVDLRTTWPVREGGTRTLKVSYVPIMGKDAQLESVLCCLTDLTEESDQLRIIERSLAEERQITDEMIARFESALEKLAGGNLDCFMSEPFPERLEPVCRRFNEAVERQCDAFSRLLGSAETLRRSAREVGVAAGDMARRTEAQASTLEESAAALEQLTVNVKASTARNAQFETEVQGAMANATAAGSVVEEAFGAMDEIESSSRQISRIIGVIDDIAFQTNLLALNAGVEAARAGDAGRGFAVVASEVRALAQRSSEAAKEIKALISLSTEQVARGVEVVGQGGAALKEVIASVHSIATMVAEVVASARDQSSGLGEIATAVSALDQTTQQTAAMVEDSTAAGQSLVHQAEGLLSIAATFHLPEGRHRRTPVPPRAPQLSGATITRLSPVTGGAAALKVVNDDDDWTEF